MKDNVDSAFLSWIAVSGKTQLHNPRGTETAPVKRSTRWRTEASTQHPAVSGGLPSIALWECVMAEVGAGGPRWPQPLLGFPCNRKDLKSESTSQASPPLLAHWRYEIIKMCCSQLQSLWVICYITIESSSMWSLNCHYHKTFCL